MKRFRNYIAALRRERELDIINNPRRMVFLSDVLCAVLLFVIAFGVMCGGVYVFAHLMYKLQIITGVA